MQISRILGALSIAFGAIVATSSPVEAVAAVAGRRLAGGNAACGGQRVRKPWRKMSQSEQSVYIEAVALAIKNGVVDDFAAMHMESTGEAQAHHSCAFFTWHRRMLLAFESYLRDQGEKYACVTLPYYDVHTAYAEQANRKCSNMYECSEIFSAIGGSRSNKQSTLVLNGAEAYGYEYSGAPYNDFCDDNGKCGVVVRNDISQRPVPSGAGFTSFQDWVTRSEDYAAFLESIQFGLHNEVHNAIGGCMSTMASPRDVLFYSWHSAIDMFLHVYHTCNFNGDVDGFMEATQSCGGISGVGAQSSIVQNIRYQGQVMPADQHPTLGKYFSHVGDAMYNYGDITKLNDYSYTYDLPDVFIEQLLSNSDVCKSATPPQAVSNSTGMPQPAGNATVHPGQFDDEYDSDDSAVSSGDKRPGKGKDKGKGKGKDKDNNGKGKDNKDNKDNKGNKGNKDNKGKRNGRYVQPGKQRGIVVKPTGQGSGDSVAYDGNYWAWAKKTYDGLVERFNGDMDIVVQQMHVAECMAFEQQYGVREFSDDFVKNFHLTSKRPTCGKKIDGVYNGDIKLVVKADDFKADTTDFKDDLVAAAEAAYKPLTEAVAPLINTEYVQKAQQIVNAYTPTTAPSVAPTSGPYPLPTPCSSTPAPKPTPCASTPAPRPMC